MAEHPDLPLIRSGYEAFGKVDMATLTTLFADNAVWHLSGRGPLSGEHRGRDAIFAIFRQLGERSGGTYHLEAHDFLASDEHTVALIRAMGSRAGKQLDSRGVDIHHLKDGKITEFWSFLEDPGAFDAFWS